MTRRRTVRSVAFVVVGSGLLVAGLASPSRAALGFSATASAYGSRMQLTVTQAPLVPELIDAGGPTADVALDSLGTSRSLAAYPYPGKLLLSLPGLVAGIGPQAATLLSGLPEVVLGATPIPIPSELTALLNQIDIPYDQLTPYFEMAPPLPPYPFAAQADSTTPHHRVDLGIGSLEAVADPDAATAVASAEPGAGGVSAVPVRATSSVKVDGDAVVAEARSVVGGLRLGPVQLGSIESSARMEMAPDGTVTPTSEFVVRGLQIGALTVDLTAEGFSVGGVPVPAPIAATLKQALAGAGLQLHVLREETTDTGVVSGALQLTYPISFAGLPAEIQGLVEVVLTVTLGQSIATLTGSPIPDLPTDIGTGLTGDAGAFVDPGAGDFATGPLDGGLSSPPAPRLPVAGVPVAAGGRLPVELFDAEGIYLAIIGAGFILSGSGGLLHAFGFRTRTRPSSTARPGGHL